MGKRTEQGKARRRPQKPQTNENRVVSGEVRLEPDGTGRLLPDEPLEAEVFLSHRQLRGVRAGDRLQVEIRKARKGRLRGRVVGKSHRFQTVVGVVERHGRSFFVAPEPTGALVVVRGADLADAEVGDAVSVRIVRDARGSSFARGVVEEVLGDPDDHRVQRELLIRALALPGEFPDDVVEEAHAVAAHPPAEQAAADSQRRDLRDIPHVTIDGEDARDFDDAVAARPERGGYRVWVSIADVSHYVEPGGRLDEESQDRATSIYFPHAVIPMLPEVLSTGMCSLNPGVERLAMTCEMHVDAHGKRSRISVYPSLVRSHGRLTYTEVQRYLDGEHPDFEHARRIDALHRVAAALRTRRMRRGSLDLNLPETQIILDSASEQPRQVLERHQNDANHLIEDLMIAANESVAELLLRRDIASIFRVHEEPDLEKLRRLQRWAAMFGIDFDAERALHDPAETAGLAAAIRGHQRADAGHMLMLRSLARARYAAENLGHYGLASEAYLHFTSPIRRYPDLVVHRSLKRAWRGSRALRGLEPLADHCSEREQRAQQAERDVKQLMACQVAGERIGEVLEATVSGVHRIGAFVQTRPLFLDGLVPMPELARAGGEAYVLDEQDQALVSRAGHRIRVGDMLTVQIRAVRVHERQIDFALAEPLATGKQAAPGPHAKRRGAPRKQTAARQPRQAAAAQDKGGAAGRGARASPGAKRAANRRSGTKTDKKRGASGDRSEPGGKRAQPGGASAATRRSARDRKSSQPPRSTSSGRRSKSSRTRPKNKRPSKRR